MKDGDETVDTLREPVLSEPYFQTNEELIGEERIMHHTTYPRALVSWPIYSVIPHMNKNTGTNILVERCNPYPTPILLYVDHSFQPPKCSTRLEHYTPSPLHHATPKRDTHFYVNPHPPCAMTLVTFQRLTKVLESSIDQADTH